jgi:hypothetical protein
MTPFRNLDDAYTWLARHGGTATAASVNIAGDRVRVRIKSGRVETAWLDVNRGTGFED